MCLTVLGSATCYLCVAEQCCPARAGELKSLKKPPAGVDDITAVVLCLLENVPKDRSWGAAGGPWGSSTASCLFLACSQQLLQTQHKYCCGTCQVPKTSLLTPFCLLQLSCSQADGQRGPVPGPTQSEDGQGTGVPSWAAQQQMHIPARGQAVRLQPWTQATPSPCPLSSPLRASSPLSMRARCHRRMWMPAGRTWSCRTSTRWERRKGRQGPPTRCCPAAVHT